MAAKKSDNDYLDDLYTGKSAQASGIANDNAAFGGDAAAQSDSLAIQQMYRDDPSITPAQIAQNEEALANKTNAVYNPDTIYDKIFGDLALAGSVAGIGLASGGILAPAVAGLAGGGAAGAVAGGVASGGLTGGLSSALQGQPIGKGALMGAVGGGIGAAAAPLASSLSSSTGLNSTLSSGLVKTGVGAVTGGIGAAANGGDPLSGIVNGAEGGALGAASGAVTGSILSGAGSIFNSGDTSVPASPGLTNPEAPSSISLSGNPMSADDPFSFLSQVQSPDGQGMQVMDGDPGEGTVLAPNSGTGTDFGFDPSQLGNIDPSSLGGAISGDTAANVNVGSGASGAGGGSNSLLSSLLSALGAGSGSGALGGISSSALSQLLGLGSTIAGGALNSSAAKGAASTYAGQTAFNPIATSTNAGTTQGGNATLSPQQQMLSQMLGGLAGSSGSALAGGPQASINSNFNNLQSGDLQAQQRLLGNTQDNEFANGVLSSTAGGYQTQGAMNAIGNQTSQNYQTAVGDANTQQQQQLANLTASLTGNQNINNSQLSQIQTGLTGAAQQSNANLAAYQPSLYANSNSTFGNALTALGSSVGNNPYPSTSP